MKNEVSSNIHPFTNPLADAQPGFHGHAAPAEEPHAPQPTATSMPSGAKRGRPSTYHPRVIDMLCDSIRRHGLSDSAAAEQMGMATSTISRWKQRYPEVPLKLQQARQEIRLHQLQMVMEAAAAENGKGWRAAAWILERLFPEDYAQKISDRFEALNLIEFRKDKDRRAIDAEDRMAQEEMRREQEAAMRAAAAAPVASSVYSEDGSHNSRNSAATEGPEVAPDVGSFGVSPTASADSRRDAKAPNPEAAPVAQSIYSESASHNSRNSAAIEAPEVEPDVRSFGVSPTASDDSRRDAEAPKADAAPVALSIYSESASRNSRNSAAAASSDEFLHRAAAPLGHSH